MILTCYRIELKRKLNKKQYDVINNIITIYRNVSFIFYDTLANKFFNSGGSPTLYIYTWQDELYGKKTLYQTTISAGILMFKDSTKTENSSFIFVFPIMLFDVPAENAIKIYGFNEG